MERNHLQRRKKTQAGKKLVMRFFVTLCLILASFAAHAADNIKVRYLYKKDAEFHAILDEFWDEKNVTMIIKTESLVGSFIWIFEKDHREANKKAKDPDAIYYKYHNLYANLLVEDHGGTLLKAKFQEFGGPLYSPEFQYPYCQVDDADNDGWPEFYLTYFGSNSEETQPLKVIIYMASAFSRKFEKAKATAWYPFDVDADPYHVDYDANWKRLPSLVQARGMMILNDIKNKKVLGE